MPAAMREDATDLHTLQEELKKLGITVISGRQNTVISIKIKGLAGKALLRGLRLADQLLQEKIKQAVQACTDPTTKLFTDPTFGPCSSDPNGAAALCKAGAVIPSKGGTQHQAKVLGLLQRGKIRWERPIYAADNLVDSSSQDGNEDEDDTYSSQDNVFASKATLFADGVSSGDVIQGNLGDCWFLSALSVVATRTDLLEQSFWRGDQYKSKGLFVCKFMKNFVWNYVLIDDRLPVFGFTDRKAGKPYFARCRNPNELWVSLIEKAYAKLHGSYEALIGGFVDCGLNDITGMCAEQVILKDGFPGFGENPYAPVLSKQKVGDPFWEKIIGYKQTGTLMGCSIQPPVTSSNVAAESNAGNGLYFKHAYALVDAAEIRTVRGESVRLVKLRNPWGMGEWTGPWSDSSEERAGNEDAIEKYFKIMKRVVGGNAEKRLFMTMNARGKVGTGEISQEEVVEINANDGTFFMSFDAWMQSFTHFFAGIDFPDSWQGRRSEGTWNDANNGGNTTKTTWINNPHFELVLEQRARVFASLSQEDPRGSETLKIVPVGFHVCSLSPVANDSNKFEIREPQKRLDAYYRLYKQADRDSFQTGKRPEPVPPAIIPGTVIPGIDDDGVPQPAYTFKQAVSFDATMEPGRYCIIPSMYMRTDKVSGQTNVGNFWVSVYSDKPTFRLEGGEAIVEEEEGDEESQTSESNSLRKSNSRNTILSSHSPSNNSAIIVTTGNSISAEKRRRYESDKEELLRQARRYGIGLRELRAEFVKTVKLPKSECRQRLQKLGLRLDGWDDEKLGLIFGGLENGTTSSVILTENILKLFTPDVQEEKMACELPDLEEEDDSLSVIHREGILEIELHGASGLTVNDKRQSRLKRKIQIQAPGFSNSQNFLRQTIAAEILDRDPVLARQLRWFAMQSPLLSKTRLSIQDKTRGGTSRSTQPIQDFYKLLENEFSVRCQSCTNSDDTDDVQEIIGTSVYSKGVDTSLESSPGFATLDAEELHQSGRFRELETKRTARLAQLLQNKQQALGDSGRTAALPRLIGGYSGPRRVKSFEFGGRTNPEFRTSLDSLDAVGLHKSGRIRDLETKRASSLGQLLQNKQQALGDAVKTAALPRLIGGRKSGSSRVKCIDCGKRVQVGGRSNRLTDDANAFTCNGSNCVNVFCRSCYTLLPAKNKLCEACFQIEISPHEHVGEVLRNILIEKLATEKQRARLDETFRTFNVDRSGWLSSPEFEKMLEVLELSVLTQGQKAFLMEKFGSNGDGKIDLTAFRNWILKDHVGIKTETSAKANKIETPGNILNSIIVPICDDILNLAYDAFTFSTTIKAWSYAKNTTSGFEDNNKPDSGGIVVFQRVVNLKLASSISINAADKLFELVDGDGSDQIDQAEFMELLVSLGIDISLNDALLLMNCLGATSTDSGASTISRSVFIKYVENISSKQNSSCSNAVDGLQDIERKFDHELRHFLQLTQGEQQYLITIAVESGRDLVIRAQDPVFKYEADFFLNENEYDCTNLTAQLGGNIFESRLKKAQGTPWQTAFGKSPQGLVTAELNPKLNAMLLALASRLRAEYRHQNATTSSSPSRAHTLVLSLVESDAFVATLRGLLSQVELPFFWLLSPRKLVLSIGSEYLEQQNSPGFQQTVADVLSQSSSLPFRALTNFISQAASSLIVRYEVIGEPTAEETSWQEFKDFLAGHQDTYAVMKLHPQGELFTTGVAQLNSSGAIQWNFKKQIHIDEPKVCDQRIDRPVVFTDTVKISSIPGSVSGSKDISFIVDDNEDNPGHFVVISVRRALPSGPTLKTPRLYCTAYDPLTSCDYAVEGYPSVWPLNFFDGDDNPTFESQWQTMLSKMRLGPTLTPKLSISFLKKQAKGDKLIGACEVSVGSAITLEGHIFEERVAIQSPLSSSSAGVALVAFRFDVKNLSPAAVDQRANERQSTGTSIPINLGAQYLAGEIVTPRVDIEVIDEESNTDNAEKIQQLQASIAVIERAKLEAQEQVRQLKSQVQQLSMVSSRASDEAAERWKRRLDQARRDQLMAEDEYSKRLTGLQEELRRMGNENEKQKNAPREAANLKECRLSPEASAHDILSAMRGILTNRSPERPYNGLKKALATEAEVPGKVTCAVLNEVLGDFGLTLTTSHRSTLESIFDPEMLGRINIEDFFIKLCGDAEAYAMVKTYRYARTESPAPSEPSSPVEDEAPPEPVVAEPIVFTPSPPAIQRPVSPVGSPTRTPPGRASVSRQKMTWQDMKKFLILNLPDGWETRFTEKGRPYFCNHANRSTQWKHPRAEIETIFNEWIQENGGIFNRKPTSARAGKQHK